MYCHSCGRSINESLSYCDGCGTAVIRANTSHQDTSSQFSNQLKATSRDAADVIKQVLLSPVGGLQPAFAGLGQQRALIVGFGLCVLFALTAAWGGSLAAEQISGILGPFGPTIGGPDGLAGFVTLTFKLLVFPASVAVVGFGVRKLSNATGPNAADIFTAGAALTPLGVAALLSGLIGIGNAEVVAALFLFALTYLILILHAGFSRVGGMTERAAAPAVPLALLLAAWLCKVVFVSLV